MSYLRDVNKAKKLSEELVKACHKKDSKELMKKINQAKQLMDNENYNNKAKVILSLSLSTAYSNLALNFDIQKFEQYKTYEIYYQRKGISVFSGLSKDEKLRLQNEFGVYGPNHFSFLLHFNYAACLIGESRILEAIDVLSKMLELSFDDPEIYLSLIQCYIKYAQHSHVLLAGDLFFAAKKIAEEQLIRYETKPKDKTYVKIYNEFNAIQIADYESLKGSYENKEIETYDEYTMWCSSNNLFLNHVNNIYYIYPKHNSDYVTFTKIMKGKVTDLRHPSIYSNYEELNNLLNNIKVTYLKARLFIYEFSISDQKEIDVTYPPALDETVIYNEIIHGMINVYKDLYSTQDKIGYFINLLLELEIPISDVTYSKVWRHEKIKEMSKSSEILNAMRWIFLDCFDDSESRDTSYDFNGMSKIRNAFEHRAITIHKIDGYHKEKYVKDESSLHLSINELMQFTFELLQITKHMFLYLSLLTDEVMIDKTMWHQ